MDNFNNFSTLMQKVMDAAIENSVDFCTEMMHDCDELDNVSLSEFRKSVIDQAEFFVANEIDPEHAGIDLPNQLKLAIAERVKDQVRVIFNFQGA